MFALWMAVCEGSIDREFVPVRPLRGLSPPTAGVENDTIGCVDDTECDRGHRCVLETRSCASIPKCEPWEGRENGHRYGECIACRSDSDCGWTANDHCWPDGGCRSSPPFFIMTFVRSENGTRSKVESATSFGRGQTMCASVVASAADERDHLDVSVKRVQMCALKQTARISKYRKGLKKKELHTKKKLFKGGEEEVRKEAELQHRIDYPYDGIEPYDALYHESTGCRTDKKSLRVYTLYDDDRSKGKKKSAFIDYHHFDAFEEAGLPGTSTICFQALPISPRNVPVYMEFVVEVSRSDLGDDESPRLLEAFGLDGKGKGKKSTWKGVVPTSQGVDLFISCPGGKEFDGVAGICERPSVANELYFWVFLVSFAVLVTGSVIFVFSCNEAQKHAE